MENIDGYIYIMDYSDCTICEIVLHKDYDDDIERLLKEYGLNIDTCSYMYSQNKINNIQTLEKINPNE